VRASAAWNEFVGCNAERDFRIGADVTGQIFAI